MQLADCKLRGGLSSQGVSTKGHLGQPSPPHGLEGGELMSTFLLRV